ncbi:facilitated trehalose transporter Tret1-like [Epargyreus clarus]|uniref:facilitated trehalose transporter Tret1-like n=1 Tax=Epargyreus clarus TaxID=520877 RepID=UPI003C2FCFA5
MEKYEYKVIFNDAGIEIRESEKNTWKPLLRQCMICSGLWCLYLMQGLYLGAPTVIVAQIRKEANDTDAVTDEMSSWLSSMPVMSSLPPMFILPWLCHVIGRKYTYSIVGLLTIIGYIIFYCSTDLYQVLISQIFFGANTAATNTFMPILISEYTSPKYRGIFLTFKSASVFWGIWISNAIGTFFYWKNIAFIAFVCPFYMLTVFAWPESPYWLAMKGRYAECAKSHRWLKGVNKNSEKELAHLITFHKKSKNVTSTDNEDAAFSCFSAAWSTISSRPFYKPALTCVLLFAQYQFSGKFVISIYAIEVLKNLTQDESAAYKMMLILDGITVFSMYVGCFLSRYFKRRTLMLLFAGTGILFLYIISLYLFLISLSIIRENHIVTILLLTIFSIAFGCGPMILVTSIYGEIVPSRYQNPIMTMTCLYNISVLSILLKLAPFMFKTLKMHGSFLFFAISSTAVIILTYIHLPETKDKTVLEIEEYFSGDKTAEQSVTLLQRN